MTVKYWGPLGKSSIISIKEYSISKFQLYSFRAYSTLLYGTTSPRVFSEWEWWRGTTCLSFMLKVVQKFDYRKNALTHEASLYPTFGMSLHYHGHPPYSLNLASWEYFSFSRLNSISKGRRFIDGDAIPSLTRSEPQTLQTAHGASCIRCVQQLYIPWRKSIGL